MLLFAIMLALYPALASITATTTLTWHHAWLPPLPFRSNYHGNHYDTMQRMDLRGNAQHHGNAGYHGNQNGIQGQHRWHKPGYHGKGHTDPHDNQFHGNTEHHGNLDSHGNQSPGNHHSTSVNENTETRSTAMFFLHHQVWRGVLHMWMLNVQGKKQVTVTYRCTCTWNLLPWNCSFECQCLSSDQWWVNSNSVINVETMVRFVCHWFTGEAFVKFGPFSHGSLKITIAEYYSNLKERTGVWF